jgi:acetylglutamate/LysW-gamma-L-alpha-aminoadipate kinase
MSTLVVKIGGSVDDPGALLDDIAAYHGPLVVVHGAHRVLDDLSTRLDRPPRFVTSARGATSRYTDDTAMDHFLMAYCGAANKRLVQRLLAHGINAVGLCAMDGGMVRGRRRADLRVRDGDRTFVLHGDHAGSIEVVDTTLLDRLLTTGFMPVICPPALGHDGVPINVDGDRLTAELAIALGATRVVIFSDTDGFLSDPSNGASTVPNATLDELPALAKFAQGRAQVKLAAVERALRGGVGRVGLCPAPIEHPLQRALDGAGTWFSVGAAVTA